jgi:hypothetical protein
MPGLPFLYNRVKSETTPAKDAVELPGSDNEWLIPSDDAKALVQYLISLKRDGEPIPPSTGSKP